MSYMTTLTHLRPIKSSRPEATVCGAKFPPAYGTIPFREASESPRLDLDGNDKRCPECWAVWRALRADGVDLDVKPTIPV